MSCALIAEAQEQAQFRMVHVMPCAIYGLSDVDCTLPLNVILCAMPAQSKSRKLTRQRISEETWHDVRRAFLVGGELRDLARKFKLSENSVLSRASREGWTAQRKNALAKIRNGGVEGMAESSQGSEHSIAIIREQLLDEHLLAMLVLSQRLSQHASSLPTEQAFDRVRNIDMMDKLTRRQLGLDGPRSTSFNVAIAVGPWGRTSDEAPCAETVES